MMMLTRAPDFAGDQSKKIHEMSCVKNEMPKAGGTRNHAPNAAIPGNSPIGEPSSKKTMATRNIINASASSVKPTSKAQNEICAKTSPMLTVLNCRLRGEHC